MWTPTVALTSRTTPCTQAEWTTHQRVKGDAEARPLQRFVQHCLARRLLACTHLHDTRLPAGCGGASYTWNRGHIVQRRRRFARSRLASFWRVAGPVCGCAPKSRPDGTVCCYVSLELEILQKPWTRSDERDRSGSVAPARHSTRPAHSVQKLTPKVLLPPALPVSA